MGRMYHLDGLRGIACLMVVLGHFMVAFYPSSVAGDPSSIHSPYDILFASTPLNIFYNGDFAVCIFFVLSGYVLSFPYLSKNDYEIVISSSVRRFPRLVIPVVVSLIFAYILLKLGMYHNGEVSKLTASGWFSTFYTFPASFKEVVKSGFYGVFVSGGTPYNVVLWTMKYELVGSFFIFGFLALFSKVRSRYLFYIAFAIIFWDTYYFAFLTGLIISDLHAHGKLNKIIFKNKIFKVSLLLASILFGSFPVMESQGMLGQTLYAVLKFKFLHVNYFVFYHIIGATAIVLLIVMSESAKKLLSHKIPKFLGDISFPIYLLHFPILCSFACSIYLGTYSYFDSYKIGFLITLISSLIIIILLSYLMYKYIDSYSVKLSKRIYNKFFKQENLEGGESWQRVNQKSSTSLKV